jgi:NAD(P)-dependent dehydrogenase (short-subunit alcohol dehydrogenase family)
LQVDVSDENSVAAAAKVVESKHGKCVKTLFLIDHSNSSNQSIRLDALVNNAGIAIADGTTAEQILALLKTNAIGAYLMGEYFAPLLKKAAGTPRIVNVTSGAGSIGNRLDRSSPFAAHKVVPYRISKAAMNMVAACQWYELGAEGFKVFIYGPGFTESNLSSLNNVKMGAKPTSEGAAPIIAMLKGERDEDDGKYIEFGQESFPW